MYFLAQREQTNASPYDVSHHPPLFQPPKLTIYANQETLCVHIKTKTTADMESVLKGRKMTYERLMNGGRGLAVIIPQTTTGPRRSVRPMLAIQAAAAPHHLIFHTASVLLH